MLSSILLVEQLLEPTLILSSSRRIFLFFVALMFEQFVALIEHIAIIAIELQELEFTHL